MMGEHANAQAQAGASVGIGAGMDEAAHATGVFVAECFDKDGRLKWRDEFRNTVVTEGKNALLTHGFKASTLTQTLVLGLIEDTGYSAISATNTAASITAAGGGSPTNGWNEAPSSTCASRGSPSMGTASAGSLATSSAVSFSIIATDTIKGAFMLMKSTGGTAPTTTVGNTNGALYSAGLFSGGDRAVANGDTLNVTYTASL